MQAIGDAILIGGNDFAQILRVHTCVDDEDRLWIPGTGYGKLIAEYDMAMGVTVFLPRFNSYLAHANGQLGKFDDAWRCIDDAATLIERTGETWHEAEILRTAGEIALLEPTPDAGKAEAYFKRALAVARQQQAKSWELRVAMSLARLWRNRGKPQQARELLVSPPLRRERSTHSTSTRNFLAATRALMGIAARR